MVGYRCSQCGFELFHPIAKLSVSALGLYDDARFPGRCILALCEHEEHVDALSTKRLLQWMEDAQGVMHAIRRVTGAPRVNLAILGNVEPHLHMHLIPRGGAGDEAPEKTPWNHPAPAKPLSPAPRESLIEQISEALRKQ